MHLERQIQLFFRRSRTFLYQRVSSVQIIVIYYLLMVLLALGLFYLPYFRQPGSSVAFIDMLFMSVSTISVTGLTTFPINEVFNRNGAILLASLFQIGGLGIMMISTFFFILSNKRISLKQRQLIMTDTNQQHLSGIVSMIRSTFLILIGFQFFGGLLFGLHFKLNGYYEHWSDAFFNGFYQAISAVTNSGFDVTGHSILPYARDYFFLFWIMFFIFIGGIGFPVIMDVRSWLKSYFKKKKVHQLPYRFSLFTKISLLTFTVLFIGGTLLIFALEKNHLFNGISFSEQWVTSMFYSITTRNAGLQIHDISEFQTTTLFIFALLMFIGCSPSSVGGGIRTTTVAVIALYLISFLKRESRVNVFGRQIDEEDVQKAIAVFMLSLMMCFGSVIFLTAIEDFSLIAIIVEVASAFGTTGMSLGITAELSFTGKIVICSLMFIGRIGMLYTLLLFVPKQTRDLGYEYPKEKIITG
ncbi:TrkH family potassium uptake protein [Enterococcus lemanii]|uniref:TrkH family potassium uptake protein n=1 Tax=Enterococcus lemanii TaxID=1159752 RepID=A0ABV9MSX1_9ENTE|nr:TrkH family potassium uptake protein [Enterococcus lemanii]MBM7709429.1 Trk-type K+ transport system membrane component [Enterococcus lemanii]